MRVGEANMNNEIDRDFYCSASMDCMNIALCASVCNKSIKGCIDCLARHRKWLTPEQFKDEYGEEYPDDGAVYWRDKDMMRHFEISSLVHAKRYLKTTDEDGQDVSSIEIVCACTPFGKPPQDWRPQ